MSIFTLSRGSAGQIGNQEAFPVPREGGEDVEGMELRWECWGAGKPAAADCTNSLVSERRTPQARTLDDI